jgi:hypothetical protein
MAPEAFPMPFAFQFAISSRDCLTFHWFSACCALWQIEFFKVMPTKYSSFVFNEPSDFFINRLFAMVTF